MKNYVVKYKSKIGGTEGKMKVSFSEEVAREIAKDLNHRFPELRHWVEEASWKKT